MLICLSGILLVFSVTPFKIDQIKIQNRSTDQVQNLRNERGGKYAKTLAKVQVRGIFLIRDIRRNILPKFIEICTATPCWCRFAQKQASQIPRTLLKRKSFQVLYRGAIHSTNIQTGPTGKRGPPQKVDLFFRNFSGWTEPIHWVLDRNFRKLRLNGSRPLNIMRVGSIVLVTSFEN